ncbi:hypothetical protein ABT336_19480 [Micromonospora sp. NPDC000207]|uniref:hypothetical protein n=1 Tax=Micromonospora sp. NPDC000207 TaxID=3154246 RepID=UPI0033291EF5
MKMAVLGFSVLVLTAPAAVLAVRMIKRGSKRLPAAARPSARGAGYLLVAASEAYLFGLTHLALFWADARDLCLSRHQTWVDGYGRAKYFPLERRCNAYIDMVPAHVNPLVLMLLGVAVAVALVAIGRAIRQHRADRSSAA